MFSEIKARLKLPTPTFWKKVQKRTAAASIALGSLAVTVASLPVLPAILGVALGYATAFTGGIAAICSLAVDDPTALPQPETPAAPAEPGS